MEIKLSKQAIITPLIGLVVGWVLFMFAFYLNLFVFPIYDDQGMYLGEEQVVRISTYLYLIAIVVFGLMSLRGQRLALRARERAGAENNLARAAHRFGNLTVIISLVGGAIYAIGNFFGAFISFGSREDNLLVRLFDVYVPILLATILVVFVLLRAFVFRKQSIKGAKKEGLSETEKALGLGYAVPIIFTAVAIIFGLVVYDVTRTDLQVWVWVVIQVIIAIGILLGTRFSSKARSAQPVAPRPRQTLAAGAANLNFVLSIVYGAAVSVMAFTFGGAAIEKLRIFPEYKEPTPGEEFVYDYGWQVEPFSFIWFFEEMFPAIVLLILAAVGIYLFITERNQVPKDKLAR
jgi:H+/gluconate symporter-like permease